MPGPENNLENNLDSNPTPKFQPTVWHLPSQLVPGLFVFATMLTLLDKTEPITAQEEMNVENILKWATSTAAAVLTMHGVASLQKNVLPLMKRYFSQKRTDSLNGDPENPDTEISRKAIRESIQTFFRDWILNASAAFGGFGIFSMVSTALTLSLTSLYYETLVLAITRTMNALGTTAILNFLHGLTGAAIPAQQMWQLVATLLTVEYSGNIADTFTNLLSGNLSPTQITWFNNIFASTAAPAAAALGAGGAYSLVKSAFNLFKPSDNSNEENRPLFEA